MAVYHSMSPSTGIVALTAILYKNCMFVIKISIDNCATIQISSIFLSR